MENLLGEAEIACPTGIGPATFFGTMADHEINRQLRAQFLELLAETGAVYASADKVGLDPSWLYKLRKTDPEVGEAWDLAVRKSVERLELEAYRRAVVGVDEPVIYQGALTYVAQRDASGAIIRDADGVPLPQLDGFGNPKPVAIKKYSDGLLTLLLKGKAPNVYRDNATVKIGNDGDEAFKVEESATATARKIAFALAVGMRNKANEQTDESKPLGWDLA